MSNFSQITSVPVEPTPAIGIALPCVLDAVAAIRLHEIIVSTHAAGDLVIDGSGVYRASTAAIQVLLAADAALVARGSRLVLEDPTPPLCDALTDLGLAADLQRWRTPR